MTRNKKFLFVFIVFLGIGAMFFYLIKIKKENIKPFECGDLVYDYEGKSYNTLKIKDKCWTIDALISAKNNDGEEIKVRCYENNPDNCILMGGVYDYKSVFDGDSEIPIKGICPTGWKIPSKGDYDNLLKELINFNLCEKNEEEDGYICEKDNYLSEIGKNFLGSNYGGSCDLVCDYEECVYNCSGLGCRNSFIYYDKSDDSRFIVGGRFYTDNCGEENAKIGFLDGGFDSLLSLRCVKN